MSMMKRFLKISGWILLLIFVLSNIIAAIQAYNFTHFTSKKVVKTKNSDSIPFSEKLKLVFTGINNPRPVDSTLPNQKYDIVRLKSNKEIECWYLKSVGARGTVIICHGYGGNKSSMLNKWKAFSGMGFNVLLVDFMGSGGSEGDQTTIGYKEAEEVKTCYDYIKQKGEKNIYLFGTSMGAAAILKTMHDYVISPTGIIIECPFGSMYQTVVSRFHLLGIPPFPFASLLTFWGGIENGFWAFSYNPSEYAKSVKCPTLLMYGAKDKKVSRNEINEIYANLAGKKELRIFQESGHDDYLKKYESQWKDSVRAFMRSTLPGNNTIDLSDTADISYFKPIWGYRFAITGNFMGSGKIDTLYEHYYSMARHRETNKFFDSVEYDDMVGLAIEQNPWSFLTCSNKKIDTLQISRDGQLFGIAWLKNEGDLLGDGKDEISYVVNWADWSSLNTCHIMTYTTHGWKELYHFEVHDWEIPDLPDYQTDYGLFGADGGHSSYKNDTVNQRLLKEMKLFSGFIRKVRPGIIEVHTWTIDADDTILRVDLIHHTPSDSTIEAGFPN